MDRRFVIWVTIDERGDSISIVARDNESLENVTIKEFHVAPKFVVERFAMLKLTDVNKSDKGEIIGRRLQDNIIIIYITYDEFQQIKEECK